MNARVAVIGGGWAGLAAALHASRRGHAVHLFEASRALGGRARALEVTLPDGSTCTVDNGQHILIGAYSETLALLHSVGVVREAALLDMPLTLRFPDGGGLRFANLPAPWDALAAVLGARGWSLADKWSLARCGGRWQRSGFRCADRTSVAQLCTGLSPRVFEELVAPLCVSALNTPAGQASGQVFLRVLQDALFGAAGGSRLLLPRVDLTTLFPAAAAQAITAAGGQIHVGQRVTHISSSPADGNWLLDGQAFDTVLLCTGASESAAMLENTAQTAPESIAKRLTAWSTTTRALQFEGIATVYAWAAGARLAEPMLALRSSAAAPAQFVFDSGALGGPQGLLAFVVSAARGERTELQQQVLQQAAQQLGLQAQALQTVVERRATFACTPGLQRPPQAIAPGLLACADYVEGPYPATLEGAVRSAAAAAALAF